LSRRTLALTMGEEIPRPRRTQIISVVADVNPRLAWDHVVANRTAIEALLDPLQRLEFPAAIAGHNADLLVVDELEAYARDFPNGARPTIEGAKAQIRLRAQTINDRFPEVERWVAQRGGRAHIH